MTKNGMTPLCAEGVQILDGLANEEFDRYLEENLKLVSLFEIDVIKAVDFSTQKSKLGA